MTNRFISSLIVVGDHRVFREFRVGAHHQNEWNIHFFDHLPQRRPEIFGCLGQQNSVHPFREQQFDGAFLFFQNVVAVADQQIVAMPRAASSAPRTTMGKERIDDVRNDHADGVRLLLCQAARNQIRTVFQFLDGGFHSLPQFFADVGLIVDHRRNREHRNAGFTSHVINAGRLGGFPAFVSGRRSH